MVILETQGLNKRFNGIKAVNDCSLEVKKGTITALIGPNGAGKTTVFNLITRLIHPDSGKILFKEKLLNDCPPYNIHRLGMGRTFQLIRLFRGFTVLENLLIAIPQREDNFLPALLSRKNTKKELISTCIELLNPTSRL
ncbi:MAG: ATP-binding cassette domain-containing protein [Candidatus Desantisbacteria bacterium]